MPNNPSPLAAALAEALTRETDPLIRNWFEALLRGGEKGSGAGRRVNPEAKGSYREKRGRSRVERHGSGR